MTEEEEETVLTDDDESFLTEEELFCLSFWRLEEPIESSKGMSYKLGRLQHPLGFGA